MKHLKKCLVPLLSLLLLFLCILNAYTATEPSNNNNTSTPLKFNADGKFTIVHLTDAHQQYPLSAMIREYIVEMLADVQPDLVVLGGDIATDPDNTVMDGIGSLELCIREICGLFTSARVPFTIAFGNHDHQFGKTNEELLTLYQKYGGQYFLGYDADPALSGCGTHNLPILSSDGSKTAFNLYIFDSGDCVYDEDGNLLGYDCVHSDQIAWYQTTSKNLELQNNGDIVPSMAFQHIIVQEIDDYVFYPVNKSVGNLGEDFENQSYLFTPIPKIHNIKNGVIFEKPCPGYYNYGQLKAMADIGDVIAVFSGHDHSNTFTVNIDGIDVVNTGGCKPQTTLRFFTSGARVITLDENHPDEYLSSMLSLLELSEKDGSKISENAEISKTEIILSTVWGKFVLMLTRLFSFLHFF